MITGLETWFMAVLPFLLNNCESWLSISAKAIQELKNYLNQLLQFYQVQRKLSLPGLYEECSVLHNQFEKIFKSAVQKINKDKIQMKNRIDLLEKNKNLHKAEPF